MIRILRPYGSTEVVEVALRDLTGADYSSVALVSGDVKISKDGAAFGNVANLPTNSSGQVRWTPDTGELNAKSIAFRIKDQTSPAEFIVSDVLIETYGHASSMHPNLGVAAVALTSGERTTLAGVINDDAVARVLGTKRTGSHGNTGISIPLASGTATGMLATDADAAPITEFNTGA